MFTFMIIINHAMHCQQFSYCLNTLQDNYNTFHLAILHAREDVVRNLIARKVDITIPAGVNNICLSQYDFSTKCNRVKLLILKISYEIKMFFIWWHRERVERERLFRNCYSQAELRRCGKQKIKSV